MTANKEKRRAVSREAAKRRRRVESDVIGDLALLLPVQPSVRDHLDKPSVIRLTLGYIRMHALLKETVNGPGYTVKFGQELDIGKERRVCHGGRDGEENKEPEGGEALEETDLYLSILEGFLLVLSSEGEMIYLSDNVNKYMGLTQTELIGHNIFDFTHPCDHQEIRNNLRLMAEGFWSRTTLDLVMRIKCALTQRGRSTNLKSAMWKVLHCQGRAKVRAPPSSAPCLLLTCQPLPLSHTLLSTHTFTSQHSMDMRFTYCDQR